MEIKKETFKLFPKEITKEQSAGTGMAIVLILLLVGIASQTLLWFKIATGVLIINMIYPQIFYPFAIVWFGLSNVMGTVMSKVILTALFLVMIFPIGLLRRLMGKDSLQLYYWKKGSTSVMKNRSHTYTPEDLEKPY